jgi:hypothetical protein
MATAAEIAALFARLEGILARVEAVLPPAPPPPDWKATAYRWRKRAGRGYLQAVRHPHAIRLADLVAIDAQKAAIDANTRQFVAGLPANNVLLTGSRGTGKSSLVKAMLTKYASRGLRLIEVDKADLIDLPDIADLVVARRERYLVFCDDLTFDAGEPGYMALKVMLDGTIAAASANMLIYATSNRRHLLPEYFSENLETKHVGDPSAAEVVGRRRRKRARAVPVHLMEDHRTPGPKVASELPDHRRRIGARTLSRRSRIVRAKTLVLPVPTHTTRAPSMPRRSSLVPRRPRVRASPVPQ